MAVEQKSIPYGSRKRFTFDAVLFGKDLLTGGIAATVAKTATAPLDRVKLLLQVSCFSSCLVSAAIGVTCLRAYGLEISNLVPSARVRGF